MLLERHPGIRIRLEELFKNIAYAVRGLRRSPGFSGLVIGTLGLALGASASLFTLMDGILLRPLPYRDPGRLVLLRETSRTADAGYGATVPDAEQWQVQAHSVKDIALFSDSQQTQFLEGGGSSQEIALISTSYNVFTTLGVTPFRGRDFTASDQTGGSERVAILSYAIWQGTYGADPAILGKAIEISGTPFEVIGVMPPKFGFPGGDSRAQIWTPLLITAKDKALDYSTPFYRAIARLNEGVSAQSAETELTAVQQRLAKGYADPLLQADHCTVRVQRYGDFLAAGQRFALFVLGLAVATVWLIGCINVANLLLARATKREQEMAIRLALGATRTRILLQCLTESLILSTAGALLGLALSAVALRLFPHAMLGSQWNVGSPFRLHAEILWPLACLTIFTAVAFGFGPAMASLRGARSRGLQQNGSQAFSSARHARIRNLLVIAELALSLTLLVSCGLLLRTLYALRHVALGFAPHHVIVVSMKIPAYRFHERNLTTDLYQPLLDQVRRLPGIETASLASSMPLQSNRLQVEMYMSNASLGGESRRIESFLRVVSPEFQKVIGLRVLRGRYFTLEDTTGSQPVVVVNRAFARLYWHSEEVIGRGLMSFGNSKPAVVVGVMEDLRQDAVSKSPQPEIQISILQMEPGHPFYQAGEASSMDLALRTSRSPASIAPELHMLLKNASPELRGASITTMDDVVSESFGSQIVAAHLLEIFASTALLIALGGLYGLLAFLVTQRTRELGVRFALGAGRGDIFVLVMRHAVLLLMGGIVSGWILMRVSTGVLRSHLYGVEPNDALTVTAICILLLLSGMAAAYIPARNAAALDPAAALRWE
jgi:predicted permease